MKTIIAMLFILALATASFADQLEDIKSEWRNQELNNKLDDINDKLDDQKFQRQIDRIRQGSESAPVYVDPAKLPKSHDPYAYEDLGFGEVDQKSLQEILNRPVPKYVPPKKGKK